MSEVTDYWKPRVEGLERTVTACHRENAELRATIESYRQRAEVLGKALEPFARAADASRPNTRTSPDDQFAWSSGHPEHDGVRISYGDLMRARLGSPRPMVCGARRRRLDRPMKIGGQPLAKTRMAMFFVAGVSGALSAWYLQPWVHGNYDAVEVLVTVFSILAGFLIAITTIMADPVARAPGSWRVASATRREVGKKLQRQKYLFYVYLATLLLIFVCTLAKDNWPSVVPLMERAYLFLGVFGFVLSFGLPTELVRMQTEAMDRIVEDRARPKSTTPAE